MKGTVQTTGGGVAGVDYKSMLESARAAGTSRVISSYGTSHHTGQTEKTLALREKHPDWFK